MWLKVCGGALLLLLAIVLLKSAKGDALPLQWTGILGLFGATFLLLQPVFTWLLSLCEAWGMSGTATIMLKGLGIAMLTQICADLCRQTGEGGIAGGVEMVGRAELLLLCLPLMRELFDVAVELLGAWAS